MSMNKVWLDDKRDPVLFTGETDWIRVYTADAAIALLAQGGVDIISLDHDLGTEDTGYTVACWIEEMAYYKKMKPLEWRIHSDNVVGRGNMERALRAADHYWDKP